MTRANWVAASTHPIQQFVPHARKRQEPRLTVVQAERRAGEWNADERILWFGFAGTIGSHEFGDFLSLISRHGDAVTGIAESVKHAVELAGVRHDVKGEVERASPDIVNFRVGQLRVDINHAAAQ